MTTQEEESMIIKVDKKVREGIDVIYTNIDNVENSILELFTVAGCVFDKQMFDSLLLDFRTFDVQSGNFETMVSQITNPVMTIAEAITLDTMMKRLSDHMDRLIEYITTCNNMVEQGNFDIKKANLLEKLHNNYAYDVVNYTDLDEAINHPFLVVRTIDVVDHDYDNNYFPMNVLKIYSFNTKTEAYLFALKNGIPKTSVILRY